MLFSKSTVSPSNVYVGLSADQIVELARAADSVCQGVRETFASIETKIAQQHQALEQAGIVECECAQYHALEADAFRVWHAKQPWYLRLVNSVRIGASH